jgi:serine/threonine protein kinase
VPDVMKTVGRYEILREVGRGGMAMVYLARQTDLDRFVALKELGAFHASDESFAQRFLRESRVAGSLSHPNVVTVHDYFQHDGTPAWPTRSSTASSTATSSPRTSWSPRTGA